MAAAVALSAAVANDGEPLPGDLRLTRWAQDLPAFHTIARAFRWGMGTDGVLILGAMAALVLWALRRAVAEPAVLLGALVVLRVTQPLIKNVVDRPRPGVDLVERRAGFSSESFPSGHMMSSVVLCVMLGAIAWGLPLPRAAQWAASGLLTAVVVLNGVSSLYMGVHWPSDVVGGLLWALLIAVPGATVVHRRRR